MERSRSATAGGLIIGLLAFTTAATAAQEARSMSPSPTVQSCPNPHGGACLGPLVAGTYESSVFDAAITYTVPDGWANLEDLPGNFLLLPPGGSLEGVDAGTSDYIGIYQGVRVAAASCESAPEPGVGSASQAMTAALSGRPGLAVTDAVPFEVGGLSGLMIDIAIDPASEGGCVVPDYPGTLVPLTIGAGPAELEHAQVSGMTTRIYFLDMGDTNIVIEIADVDGSAGETDDYLDVVSGLEFADG